MTATAKTIQVENENHFHELRSKGIGSSDIAAVIGVSPYKTPLELWKEKTGRKDQFEGNKYTEAGTLLEPVVAAYFENKTEHRVIKKTAAEYLVVHPDHDFIRVHPDREYFISDKVGRGVLECKTVNHKSIDLENIPMEWFCQNQYQIGTCGHSEGHIAWLEWGLNFFYKRFDFDPSFYEYLVNEAGAFWVNNVLKDIPPEPINEQDVLDLFPSHETGKKIAATDMLYGVYQKIVELKEKKSSVEADLKHYAEQVKLAMQDAESVVWNGETLFTWKKAKDSLRISSTKLKKENPELFNSLAEVTPGARRFLVKGI